MKSHVALMLLAAGTISVLAAGCCIVPFPSYEDYLAVKADTPEREQKAKEMEAPADKALVYYFRIGPYRPVKERSNRVYVDEFCVGNSIWPPGFYLWLLPPGVHTIETQGSKVVLDAVGGETYFIQEQGEFLSFNVKVKLVDKEAGRKNIRRSRLLKANEVEECGRVTIRSGDETRNLIAPKDKALVYLYRRGIDYDHQDAIAQLDGRPPVELAAGTFLLWQLTPGMHVIETKGGHVAFYCNAGSKYYIRLDVVHKLWGAWSYPLQLMDNEEGSKGVEKTVPMEGPLDK